MSIKEQMKMIPCKNFYMADRYDTDDMYVLHVWDQETGESFDLTIPKNELPSARPGIRGVTDEVWVEYRSK